MCWAMLRMLWVVFRECFLVVVGFVMLSLFTTGNWTCVLGLKTKECSW